MQSTSYTAKKQTKTKQKYPLYTLSSPECGVDLQRFAQHLGSDVVHVVPAQVHFSQAGVAAQSVDQHGATRAQARLG